MRLIAALLLASAPLPPPSFAPAQGWVATTTRPDQAIAPAVWVATRGSKLAGVGAWSIFGRLSRLSARGVVIGATTIGRGAPGEPFPRAKLPLRLGSFRVDRGWEGQPDPRIQQRLRVAAVGGWWLDVRVYFGTQRPGRALLRRAQLELARLRLPTR
jgi:hypothetical protein